MTVVFLLPVHLLSIGGVHRLLPVGGTAKGIPFQDKTPGATSDPTMGPVVVCT